MEQFIKTLNGSTLTITLKGRLDTMNSMEFTEVLMASLDNIKLLELDFKELYYISSTGLRSLLQALKKMKQQGGEMVIHNLSQDVHNVFTMTGFDQIIKIE